MDSTAMQEFLHMIQGDGELGFARNTFIERAPAANTTKSIMEKAIECLVAEGIISRGDQVVRVADLGCGVGPIPLALTSTILELFQKKFKQLKCGDDQVVPELQLFFNDLPTNNFNLLFKHLDELRRQVQDRGVVPWCFAMAVPGSFHGRLFPRNSLHLLHSNLAVHWLSQVPSGLPENRNNIYLPTPTVTKAYQAQFQRDWISLLSCRAEEMVTGGRIVFVCRASHLVPHQPVWELHLLGQAIASLVSQGVIEKDKLDTFNVPIHCPTRVDIEEAVQKEGSFEIEEIEIVNHQRLQDVQDTFEKAVIMAKTIRGFTKSMVLHHFGEEVLDKLYDKLTEVIFKYVVAGEPYEVSSIIVRLKRTLAS